MSTTRKGRPDPAERGAAEGAASDASGSVEGTPTAEGQAAPAVAEPRAKVRVILPADKRPGVIKVGAYSVGVPHEVSADIADDLIARKGFEIYVEPAKPDDTTSAEA